jgi:hypothetical protein
MSRSPQGIGAVPDFSRLSVVQLQSYIGYHHPKNGPATPEYLAALEERERRQGSGLDFRKTFAIVSKAASEGRYVSYGEVAVFSGLTWKTARRLMPKHLGNLCEYAHRKGWPLLSSVIVNKENLRTGELEPQSLDGFIKAARELGYLVTDEMAFLREQQQRVFEWAKHRQSADG